MANKGTYMLRNIMLKEMTAGSTWSDTETRKDDEKMRDDYTSSITYQMTKVSGHN